jgi:hypothetical protein
LTIDGTKTSFSGDSYTSNKPIEDFNAFLELCMSLFSYTDTAFERQSGSSPLSDRPLILSLTAPGACGTVGRECPYVSGTLENKGLNHAAIYLLTG